MRDWHDIVIKLPEARNLISDINLKNGNSELYIGVIEDYIQYEKIDQSLLETDVVPIDNYKASHIAFTDNTGKKIFYRQANGTLFNENLPKNALIMPEPHTVAVAGIIAANNNGNIIGGIAANVKIINGNKFRDIIAITGTGLYIASNIFAKNLSSSFTIGINLSQLDIAKVNNNIKLPYSNIYASIINCSFNWKSTNNAEFNSKSVNVIAGELFAYADNGRGALIIAAAGNENTTVNEVNSSYVFSVKPLLVAASKVILDVNQLNNYTGVGAIAFNESYADYSNKGKRIDLCAPSGPDSNPGRGDIEIYSTTVINGGQVGSDDQLVISVVLNRQNNTTLILQNLDKRIMAGQSIELGDPNTFFHEITFITKVETVLFDGHERTKVYLDEALKYTRQNNTTGYDITGKTVRITIFVKDVLSIIGDSTVRLKDFKGIGSVQNNKKQEVYIYNENNISDGIKAEIIVTQQPATTIKLNKPISSLGTTNLKIIPGKFKIKIVKNRPNSSSGTSDFKAATNYTSQGFFTGQLVVVDGSIKHVTVQNNILYFKHYRVTDAPGSTATAELNLETASYGNYTSSFTGTSAASPITSGLASLVKSVNPNLNAAEIKHILKFTTDKIGASYSLQNTIADYNYGYEINERYGSGRINAKKAVQLALDWHSSNPTQTVQKPIMHIADKLSGGYTGNVEQVALGQPVDSPDIWIKKLNDSNTSLPTVTAPFNNMSTDSDQKIFIRIRNTGSRRSFAECDIRVFLVFTDDEMPKFPFPEYWYDHDNVKIVDVKPIGFIEPGSSTIVTADWKNIKSDFELWNPADSEGKRKKTFILAHIAPFDGAASEVQLSDIRLNKQLTCKEIIVTHTGIRYGGIIIPGNSYNIPLENNTAVKTFALDINNIQSGEINSLVLKFIRKNRADASEEIITFSKTESIWSITGNQNPDWISFSQPVETPGSGTGYKNIVFPHTLSVNEDEENVRLEIVNT